MSVTIARGVVGRIRESPEAITIQAADPSNPGVAAAALRDAGEEISDLDGGPASAYGLGPGDRNNPKWVSDVIEVPGGPMLMVDGGFTPFRLLREIPQIVARCLEANGVSAVVRVPTTTGPLEHLRGAPRCVLLRIYAPPPRRKRVRVQMPAEWLVAASSWLRARGGDEVMCSLQAVEFPALGRNVSSLLAGWERQRPGYAVLGVGDPASSLRGIGADFTAQENVELVFVAGGPEEDDDGLLRAFDELRAIARQLAPTLAYAFISIEPTFGQLLSCGQFTEWHGAFDGPGPGVAGWLCDEIVPDAFPYQILGPGHFKRLASVEPEHVALSDTRSELAIGAAADWLFGTAFDPNPNYGLWRSDARRDPTIQGRARELLQPCLVSAEEGHQLLTARLTGPAVEGET